MALTKSERQIMDLLWNSDEALTTSEIIEKSPDKCWKSSYVHLLVNSLLKKGVIEVEGMKRTTKNYARTFRAALTQQEYMFQEMNLDAALSPKSLTYLISALIKKTDDTELIEELETILQNRKDELK